jgi:pyrroline-5-carboxylate reductase
MVTSPGGTTIAGIQVMEEYKIRATLLKTVETATRRSAQLGQQNAARINREGSAHGE